MLKKLSSHLPLRTQQTLKRLHFARLIRKGVFTTAETEDHEFPRLAEWVAAGDWVLDVGANVGNYTARMSELVGPTGRVLAFEPVPETFELLVANLALFPYRNVTFVNAAISSAPALVGMAMPMLDSGMENRYMASIVDGGGPVSAFAMPIDALGIPQRVAFVKVDVEGHELQALHGMQNLLRRDRPVLVVEGRDAAVAAFMAELGYGYTEAPRSPNRVYTARG